MINTLIPIIEGLPDPLDFKDEHHTWLSPLKLKSTASSHPEFIQLVDQFAAASKGTRKSNHVKTLRKHWELILLNLTYVVFHRRWLLVALDNRAFSSVVSRARAFHWLGYQCSELRRSDLEEGNAGRNASRDCRSTST